MLAFFFLFSKQRLWLFVAKGLFCVVAFCEDSDEKLRKKAFYSLFSPYPGLFFTIPGYRCFYTWVSFYSTPGSSKRGVFCCRRCMCRYVFFTLLISVLHEYSAEVQCVALQNAEKKRKKSEKNSEKRVLR